jgi:hypothetical protein
MLHFIVSNAATVVISLALAIVIAAICQRQLIFVVNHWLEWVRLRPMAPPMKSLVVWKGSFEMRRLFCRWKPVPEAHVCRIQWGSSCATKVLCFSVG